MSEQTSSIKRGFSGRGKLCFEGPVDFFGEFDGEFFNKATLTVHPSGTITGSIECENLTLAGKVSGDIRVNGTAYIRAGCSLEGRLVCRYLKMEKGAFVQGEVLTSPETEVKSKASGTTEVENR